MYIPAVFSQDDPRQLFALIQHYPFATLISHSDEGLLADALPLLLTDDGGVLRGHLSRDNPHWRILERAEQCLVTFQGPQGYVSPGWYASKRQHGKVVPTWNYQAVHCWGTPRVVTDADWLNDLLRELTARHEQSRAEPWSMDDAPPEFIQGLMQGVVGIEVSVTRMQGKWKLSQNRSAEDRAGVAAGLRAAGNAALADGMAGGK